MTIEKLPCSSEGYEKAKELLPQTYGEESEVINAHVTQILSLPVIHGTPRAKIHEFYDKLLGHVTDSGKVKCCGWKCTFDIRQIRWHKI